VGQWFRIPGLHGITSHYISVLGSGDNLCFAENGRIAAAQRVSLLPRVVTLAKHLGWIGRLVLLEVKTKQRTSIFNSMVIEKKLKQFCC